LFKGHEKNPHIEALGKYLNCVGRVYTSTHLSVSIEKYYFLNYRKSYQSFGTWGI